MAKLTFVSYVHTSVKADKDINLLNKYKHLLVGFRPNYNAYKPFFQLTIDTITDLTELIIIESLDSEDATFLHLRGAVLAPIDTMTQIEDWYPSYGYQLGWFPELLYQPFVHLIYKNSYHES